MLNVALRVLCRVISRRIASGEKLDEILPDYPALTAIETQLIKTELGVV
jgi:uncharacterized protein (DUF433 family)